MNDALARKKFTEFKERSDRISDTALDEYWASLTPATIADMIGEWQGGEFDTGHRMNGRLEKAAGSARPSTRQPTCSPGVSGRRRQQVLQRRDGQRRGQPVDGGIPRRDHRDDGL
ncbi:GXWXG family protein [Mycobacterium xenopi 3993]|nr:GXWXG family protein [Mycobacterium xenopi 3993]